MRLSELAAELGAKPADMLKKLYKLGIPLRDEDVVLDDEEISLIRDHYEKISAKKKPPAKKAVKKEAEPKKEKVAKPKSPRAKVTRPKVTKEEVPADQKAPKRTRRKPKAPVPEESQVIGVCEVSVATVPSTEDVGVGTATIPQPDTLEKPSEFDTGVDVTVVPPPIDRVTVEEVVPVASAEAPILSVDQLTDERTGVAPEILARPTKPSDTAVKIPAPPKHVAEKAPQRPVGDELDEDEKAILSTTILPKIQDDSSTLQIDEFEYSDHHVKVERIRKRRPIIRKEIIKRKRLKKKDILDRVGIIPRVGKIPISLPITVKELSQALGIKMNLLIPKLMENNMFFTANDYVSEDVVELLARAFNLEVEVGRPRDIEEELAEEMKFEDREGDLRPRAPVVTFLGHVDHGKTSLLDRVRKTNVAAAEYGGITQHIGAYKVQVGDKHIVFLDTPGHEAFTEMRARGANATDIAVLVVAADEGVMPQTEEAIDHARAANVPILVACNKMDKPTANANRVKQQLAEFNLLPEEWGGKTVFVEVSALTGQGIDELLEMLLLEAELMELKANPTRPASGIVLEASIAEGRGPLATLLVQQGTLGVGDVLLAGKGYGRVRAMTDEFGRAVKEAPPSTPVRVLGWSELPEAGDKFHVVKDYEKAKAAATLRKEREKKESLTRPRHVTLETFFRNLSEGKTKEFRIILKADVKGSVEVLSKSLTDLSTDEVKVVILRAGVGAINHSDVILADASDAVIIGFHVGPDEKAAACAAEKGVDIREYRVIFHAVDEVRAAIEGLLEPEEREEVLGRATVKQLFRISRLGNVCGCLVTDGKIERSNRVRLLRDGQVIYSGRIESMRRFQEDVNEVKAGYDCGIKLQGFNDAMEGDVIEAFEIQKIARKLR